MFSPSNNKVNFRLFNDVDIQIHGASIYGLCLRATWPVHALHSKLMNDEKQPVRVGLIGYGYAGRTFHAPLIRSVPGLALTHVGSTKPDLVQAEMPGSKVCCAAGSDDASRC